METLDYVYPALPLLGAGLEGITKTLLRGWENACGKSNLGSPGSWVSRPLWKTTQRSWKRRVAGPWAYGEERRTGGSQTPGHSGTTGSWGVGGLWAEDETWARGMGIPA